MKKIISTNTCLSKYQYWHHKQLNVACVEFKTQFVVKVEWGKSTQRLPKVFFILFEFVLLHWRVSHELVGFKKTYTRLLISCWHLLPWHICFRSSLHALDEADHERKEIDRIWRGIDDALWNMEEDCNGEWLSLSLSPVSRERPLPLLPPPHGPRSSVLLSHSAREVKCHPRLRCQGCQSPMHTVSARQRLPGKQSDFGC